MKKDIVGALVGWRRETTPHGAMFKLRIAESRDAFAARSFDSVAMTLNDRQLRSFARDTIRAAKARGLELEPKSRRRFLFF